MDIIKQYYNIAYMREHITYYARLFAGIRDIHIKIGGIICQLDYQVWFQVWIQMHL